jgi:tRNA dimethylallyltransferase
MKPKVMAVVGPTASGKTKLAIELAHKYNGEVISADSRLVYKGFDIASAKPTIEEREGIPHHIIDIVEPEFDYSAGDYARDGKKAIEDVLSRRKTPIVAGGTGLYFRVLLEHYNLPQVDTNYELREELEQRTKEDLVEELKILDKTASENLTPDTSKRRIIRILELIKTLQRPLSEIETQKEPEYDVEWIIPEMPSREWLYDRINKRVDIMYEQGIVDETKRLLEKHGRISNFTETIGYKEILMYLDGVWSLDEALDKLKQHTRNYAKRQLTWFRKNPNLEVNI